MEPETVLTVPKDGGDSRRDGKAGKMAVNARIDQRPGGDEGLDGPKAGIP